MTAPRCSNPSPNLKIIELISLSIQGGSDLGETETEAMATFMYYVSYNTSSVGSARVGAQETLTAFQKCAGHEAGKRRWNSFPCSGRSRVSKRRLSRILV